MSSAHDQAPAGGAQNQPGRGAGTGTHEGTPQRAGTQQGQGTQQAQQASRYVPRPSPGYDDTGYAAGETGAAVMGLTLLAAVLMMLSGIWNFLEGLAAIISGSFFVVLPNYVYSVSVAGWGWIHLILGAVVFAAGAALIMDKLWARVTAIALVSASAVLNFLYIPYLPVWSIVVIAIDVFVLWALLSPRPARA